MSAQPDDGVVNAFGQTHDIDNLFVSDGSQFPTSTSENPTLTIVALALRQAEYLAMAQNAQVGLAQANLYPSFSLSGSLGLTAAGSTETTRTGESGFGQLFDTDSLTYAVGPSFVWPFLNYDRIKNSVRVQDARLQQSLVAYRDTVLRAAREVEDALVALYGAIQQEALLAETVASARRSTEVAQLRFGRRVDVDDLLGRHRRQGGEGQGGEGDHGGQGAVLQVLHGRSPCSIEAVLGFVAAGGGRA